MPSRANSFARALKDAEKRLGKAQAEKKQAQARLYALDMEIPILHRTIAALRGHFEPVQVPDKPYLPSFDPAPPANMTPEELAKWYVDRDLSGVGSIAPEKPVAPAVPVSEDELLPDDFEVKN
jgi:hypothetical protein